VSNRGTYPDWILPAVCVVFVMGVVAVFGLGAYFFGSEFSPVLGWLSAMGEKAKASVTVVEERPEVRARLEEKYPGETMTVQDRIMANGDRSLSVGLVNSQHAQLDSEAKTAVAYGVAKLAFDTHPRASELIHISVHFSTVTTAGPVSREENSDPYRFTPEELSESEARAVQELGRPPAPALGSRLWVGSMKVVC